jgi:hypothetical protein
MNAPTRIVYRPLIPVDAAQFADETLRQQWRDEKGMIVFQMLNPHRESTRIASFMGLKAKRVPGSLYADILTSGCSLISELPRLRAVMEVNCLALRQKRFTIFTPIGECV